jgi:hypothetical protein
MCGLSHASPRLRRRSQSWVITMAEVGHERWEATEIMAWCERFWSRVGFTCCTTPLRASGPRFAPVMDKRYVAGLGNWGSRQIHVTRGVGNVGGVRFGCRPEVSLLVVH